MRQESEPRADASPLRLRPCADRYADVSRLHRSSRGFSGHNANSCSTTLQASTQWPFREIPGPSQMGKALEIEFPQAGVPPGRLGERSRGQRRVTASGKEAV